MFTDPTREAVRLSDTRCGLDQSRSELSEIQLTGCCWSHADELPEELRWFQLFRQELLRTLAFSDHETYDLPVASTPCMLRSHTCLYSKPIYRWQAEGDRGG